MERKNKTMKKKEEKKEWDYFVVHRMNLLAIPNCFSSLTRM